MRTLLCGAALMLAMVSSGQASAAEPGKMSQATLAKMGLGGIKPLTDAEGSQVRGRLAFGFSGSFAWSTGFAPSVNVPPPAFSLFGGVSRSSFAISGSAVTGGSGSAFGF